jgi:hypothetical protein
MLIGHWIVEVDFSSIDFAWDGTLLGVHSCMREVALEVVLGHVCNASGNKFDVNFAVLASHDSQLLIGLVPCSLLGLLQCFSLLWDTSWMYVQPLCHE